ncbi:very short patch repair endonuclease [Pseudomonas fulva]|uniref:very short patch repair endonuclease n=1 Tax=Pseudomonas fulva TaxID=47880 RepID=UPI0018AADD86|nr:very short patch repair endonuclease [Pseudomonas fulva]MBF8678602.1 DNA mismatch endonuclease Vsr [Pseudomonas fulva]MBF8717013.1 DNA mismatch endonuclease Vsr [Pseudomonas fulva]MBF8782558.1 DNA mismatch endonuclease Vsr [Pseudomonas fulva]
MDVVDSLTRSRMMSGIRAKNTKPELMVRRFLHAHGYRFRIHRKDLPGNPDLVFPKLKVCIFVHGCFWHRHPRCRYATNPKTRPEFWSDKFQKNVARDLTNIDSLEKAGWRVLVVWECQLKNNEKILAELLSTLKQIKEQSLASTNNPSSKRARATQSA